VAFVAGGVAFEFFSPPSRSCHWNPGVFALTVKMPEASMDKDTDAVSRQNDVRTAWQIAPMEAEAVVHEMQQTSDKQFRLRVFAANAAHQAAALLRTQSVCHGGTRCLRF
jgi:hypothetical protein